MYKLRSGRHTVELDGRCSELLRFLTPYVQYHSPVHHGEDEDECNSSDSNEERCGNWHFLGAIHAGPSTEYPEVIT